MATPEQRGVRLVSVECLRTSFSALRAGPATIGPECELKPLPLRVVAGDDGCFEILDGFKRFAVWRAEGQRDVPVMIESPGSSADHKRLLLLANAPRRTLTPLDEALVVESLLEQDGLSPSAAAKLLGHKKKWVMERRALAKGLSPFAQKKVANREIGPTLAHHLTSLPSEDQEKLLECFSHHRLKRRDQLVVLQGYRVADAADRRSLLASPMSILPPNPSPAFSPRLHELEQRLEDISRAIADLGEFRIPSDLPSNERHRLEALVRHLLHEAKRVLADIPHEENADEFTTETADAPGGSRFRGSGEDSGNVSDHQHSPVIKGAGDLPDDGRAGARASRAANQELPSEVGQARRIPKGTSGTGRQGADRVSDSPRDHGIGVSGKANDPGRPRQSIASSGSACSPPSGQAAV